MRAILFEPDLFVKIADLAIDPHADEAGLARLVEHLLVLAAPVAHQRREQQDTAAIRQREDGVHHLLRGLPLKRAAVVRAVRPADAGEQQAQVVVDLGDRADRRARVAAAALLVDGDRRRETLDRVHVRLVELAEELAGVGRERLDVATLALGEDRVERQRGFAGAGEPGEHHQPVARQADVDILQIVLARPAHANQIICHRWLPARSDAPKQGWYHTACSAATRLQDRNKCAIL